MRDGIASSGGVDCCGSIERRASKEENRREVFAPMNDEHNEFEHAPEYDLEYDPWKYTMWPGGLPSPPIPHVRSPEKIALVEYLWANQDGYVYVLSGDVYYKIGRAKNVLERFRMLRL
jgi:hypothetical protein